MPLPATSSTAMHALPDAWLMPPPAAAYLRSGAARRKTGSGCVCSACCTATRWISTIATCRVSYRCASY